LLKKFWDPKKEKKDIGSVNTRAKIQPQTSLRASNVRSGTSADVASSGERSDSIKANSSL
jgi:hypothetical protein